MKTQARELSGKAVWLTLLLSSGVLFASQAFGQPVLNLKVNNYETALVLVNETGTGKCAGKQPGDVCAAKNQKPTIRFNLTGSRDCNAGDKWDLSRVVLAPDGTKPGTWGNISREAADDFTADMTSGVVTPVSHTARKIDIKDENNHVLVVWYKVEATCDTETIQYDPRVRNGGTN